MLGFCAGGILMTTVLNHLAANGDDRVHSAGYAVTLLDFHSRAPIGAFSSPRLLDSPGATPRRAGVITARQMGAVFTWMRPDDLVFNYLVTSGCWARNPRRSTSSPGTPTGRTCPRDCTSSSWTSSATTR